MYSSLIVIRGFVWVQQAQYSQAEHEAASHELRGASLVIRFSEGFGVLMSKESINLYAGCEGYNKT